MANWIKTNKVLKTLSITAKVAEGEEKRIIEALAEITNNCTTADLEIFAKLSKNTVIKNLALAKAKDFL